MALFYFVFEGNFPSTSPRGAYIWRGDLTEGFLRYRFRGLIFGGAYFRNFKVLYTLSLGYLWLLWVEVSCQGLHTTTLFKKNMFTFVNRKQERSLRAIVRISYCLYSFPITLAILFSPSFLHQLIFPFQEQTVFDDSAVIRCSF